MSLKHIQVWPSGRGYRVDGEWPTYTTVQDYDGNLVAGDELAKATREIRIAELAEMYQDRDILACQTWLIDDILKLEGEGVGIEGMTYEDVENMRPDASDWDFEKCREWIEDKENTHDYEQYFGFDPYNVSRDRAVEELTAISIECNDDESLESLREALISAIDDGDIAGLEEMQSYITENADEAEVYEWWLVSSWFADKLYDLGEVVLRAGGGTGHWWGRCTTGQMYIMDGVLQKVAEHFADV